MKTIDINKRLRYQRTMNLLNRASAMGDPYATGILQYLDETDLKMRSLKESIEEIHCHPDADPLSREYYAEQDKNLSELIDLERQRRVILRAVQVQNLPNVLQMLIPTLNKQHEEFLKK